MRCQGKEYPQRCDEQRLKAVVWRPKPEAEDQAADHTFLHTPSARMRLVAQVGTRHPTLTTGNLDCRSSPGRRGIAPFCRPRMQRGSCKTLMRCTIQANRRRKGDSGEGYSNQVSQGNECV